MVAVSVASAFAAFVGNSSRMAVVWVCTAMSASARSCISVDRVAVQHLIHSELIAE